MKLVDLAHLQRTAVLFVAFVIALAAGLTYHQDALRAALVVNTNLQSINAQRKLSETANALSQTFQRISSGLRINRAADDAAGLGVSEMMDASLRSLAQASRNAQDGISLLQTAEGAYSEIGNILVRMRELAIQSANGKLVNSDRQQLATEYEQLVAEISSLTASPVLEMGGLTDTNHVYRDGLRAIAAKLAPSGGTSVVSLKAVAAATKQIETSRKELLKALEKVRKEAERDRQEAEAAEKRERMAPQPSSARSHPASYGPLKFPRKLR